VRVTRCTLPCRAELLQLHLELRGEKALDYDLYVGDYTGASLHPGDDARVVSLHAACAGGAPRRGLASGSPRRVANALRGLFAAAGVRLQSRCEAVDLDDTIEGAAGGNAVMGLLHACSRIAARSVAWYIEVCMHIGPAGMQCGLLHTSQGHTLCTTCWPSSRRKSSARRSVTTCGCCRADFALPFVQLTAVACKRSTTTACLETLPRAGEAKHEEVIAAVSPVASLPCAQDLRLRAHAAGVPVASLHATWCKQRCLC
jgi:hypothetical protein